MTSFFSKEEQIAIEFSEKSSMIVSKWVRNPRKDNGRFRVGDVALESGDAVFRRTWGSYGREEEEAGLVRVR